MKQLIVITTLFLAFAALRADDITLADGTVYKNATIISHSVTSATIETDNGGAIVPLAKLPPDLQKKCGYDPRAAKDAMVQREKDSAAAEAALSEESAYGNAVKRYVMVDGEIKPIAVAHAISLQVVRIGEGSPWSDTGQRLPAGTYCDYYELAFECPPDVKTIPLVKRGQVFLAGDQIAASSSPIVVQATASGQTSDGVAVFLPVRSFTIDQWRAAGRPQ